MKVIRLSALRTGRLYLQEIFLVLISVTSWVYPQGQGRNAVRRIMSMKNSSDTNGNRTCDLPTCRAVPQPTAIQCSRSNLPGRQNYEKIGSRSGTNGTRDKRLQFLVGNPDRNKRLGKPNNNNMDTQRIWNLFIWIWISTSGCFSWRW